MPEEVLLPLTERQSEVLHFLLDFFHSHRYPPTIAEIQRHLEIRNPGMVSKTLKALEKKGYIRKVKHVARGVRLTPLSRELMRPEDQLTFRFEGIKPTQY